MNYVAIAEWLGKYWWLALIALLLATIQVQHLVIERDDATISGQKAQITELSDANLAFKQAIDKQDMAVMALKADADRRARIAAPVLAAAQKAQKSYQASAARIERENPSGDPCVASHRLLTDYMKGLRP